jgi:hypothetical protein
VLKQNISGPSDLRKCDPQNRPVERKSAKCPTLRRGPRLCTLFRQNPPPTGGAFPPSAVRLVKVRREPRKAATKVAVHRIRTSMHIMMLG